MTGQIKSMAIQDKELRHALMVIYSVALFNIIMISISISILYYTIRGWSRFDMAVKTNQNDIHDIKTVLKEFDLWPRPIKGPAPPP